LLASAGASKWSKGALGKESYCKGTAFRRLGCAAVAIKPVSWPAFSDWRAVLVRTWKEAGDDNVGLLAAGVAFFAFLAFVPLLASVVLIYGLAADPATVAEHIGTLARKLPPDAAALIADQLRSMTESPQSAKGFALLLAIILAIYGASKGSSAVVTTLNIAYEVKETRSYIRTTLLSLAMTIGAMLVLFLGVGAISAMAYVEALLPGAPPFVHRLVQILFWAGAASAVSVGVALVYRYGPNRPDAPWRWITPGSAAATLAWLLASFGFGLYVAHFGNYNATYGSLGGVIVFLTWLYLSGYILLMGGELNSELERQRAKDEREGR
jgi:membrane protein